MNKQAEIVWRDISTDESLSWAELFAFINNQKVYYPNCESKTATATFIHLMTSLAYDLEISFQKESSDVKAIPLKKRHVPFDRNTFREQLKNLQNWKVILYTSGTTGRPKKVVHSFASLTQNIKIDSKHADHIWALAYNLNHMSGLQVFLQAILNGNAIVRVFDAERHNILMAFNAFKITSISSTPTFFRLLFPIDEPILSVCNISFGGEIMDPNLIAKINYVFPNATIRNIYASTEAGALLASDGKYFKIGADYDGKIKIVDHEIWIHKSVLGLLPAKLIENDWYQSGDIVEYKAGSQTYFSIVARKNELINIGGYKVNPNEIEKVLNAHPMVKKARVFGKKNALIGHILLCEIEKLDADLDEQKVKTYLKTKLEDYQIPRIVNFVAQIKTTETGKLLRT